MGRQDGDRGYLSPSERCSQSKLWSFLVQMGLCPLPIELVNRKADDGLIHVLLCGTCLPARTNCCNADELVHPLQEANRDPAGTTEALPVSMLWTVNLQVCSAHLRCYLRVSRQRCLRDAYDWLPQNRLFGEDLPRGTPSLTVPVLRPLAPTSTKRSICDDQRC